MHGTDVLEDYYSPRVSACHVLTDIVTLRASATLDRTMAFLGSVCCYTIACQWEGLGIERAMTRQSVCVTFSWM